MKLARGCSGLAPPGQRIDAERLLPGASLPAAGLCAARRVPVLGAVEALARPAAVEPGVPRRDHAAMVARVIRRAQPAQAPLELVQWKRESDHVGRDQPAHQIRIGLDHLLEQAHRVKTPLAVAGEEERPALGEPLDPVRERAAHVLERKVERRPRAAARRRGTRRASPAGSAAPKPGTTRSRSRPRAAGPSRRSAR